MLKKTINIGCPKEMLDNYKTLDFILSIEARIPKNKMATVVWNFKTTKKMETCILAIIAYIFDNIIKQGNQLVVLLKDKKSIDLQKSVYELFQYYSIDKRAFFKVRRLGLAKPKETDDLLLKYLKNLNLKEYEKIKILISELIANIKMHTIYREGIISSFNKNDKEIIISLVNYDITIEKNIKNKLKMNFKSDFDAIIWALKKTNSTRNDNESGGLGLYLMRKYINELDGNFSIISGHCYLLFNDTSYESENENSINYIDYKYMKNYFNGNIFTLHIPYLVLENKMKNQNGCNITNYGMIDLMEDI